MRGCDGDRVWPLCGVSADSSPVSNTAPSTPCRRLSRNNFEIAIEVVGALLWLECPPTEQEHRLAVLHAVCARLSVLQPTNRPRTLVAFSRFSRSMRSIVVSVAKERRVLDALDVFEALCALGLAIRLDELSIRFDMMTSDVCLCRLPPLPYSHPKAFIRMSAGMRRGEVCSAVQIPWAAVGDFIGKNGVEIRKLEQDLVDYIRQFAEDQGVQFVDAVSARLAIKDGICKFVAQVSWTAPRDSPNALDFRKLSGLIERHLRNHIPVSRSLSVPSIAASRLLRSSGVQLRHLERQLGEHLLQILQGQLPEDHGGPVAYLRIGSQTGRTRIVSLTVRVLGLPCRVAHDAATSALNVLSALLMEVYVAELRSRAAQRTEKARQNAADGAAYHAALADQRRARKTNPVESLERALRLPSSEGHISVRRAGTKAHEPKARWRRRSALKEKRQALLRSCASGWHAYAGVPSNVWQMAEAEPVYVHGRCLALLGQAHLHGSFASSHRGANRLMRQVGVVCGAVSVVLEVGHKGRNRNFRKAPSSQRCRANLFIDELWSLKC